MQVTKINSNSSIKRPLTTAQTNDGTQDISLNSTYASFLLVSEHFHQYLYFQSDHPCGEQFLFHNSLAPNLFQQLKILLPERAAISPKNKNKSKIITGSLCHYGYLMASLTLMSLDDSQFYFLAKISNVTGNST